MQRARLPSSSSYKGIFGPQKSEAPLPLPCPWNVCSVHRSQSRSCFQGHNPETVRCTWDHLKWIGDQTQLRSQYELWRFFRWVWRSTGLVVPMTCLVRNLLILLPLHLLIWSGLPLSLVSSCPLCMGASFRFHLGKSWGWELIKGLAKLGYLYIYPYRAVILDWSGTQRSFLELA